MALPPRDPVTPRAAAAEWTGLPTHAAPRPVAHRPAPPARPRYPQHRPQQWCSPPEPHLHPRGLFHESADPTRRFVAEPPPYPQPDHQPPSAHRRVGQVTLVSAVHPGRVAPTAYAGHRRRQGGRTSRPRPLRPSRSPPRPGAAAATAHHDQHTAGHDPKTPTMLRVQATPITKSGPDPNCDVSCSPILAACRALHLVGNVHECRRQRAGQGLGPSSYHVPRHAVVPMGGWPCVTRSTAAQDLRSCRFPCIQRDRSRVWICRSGQVVGDGWHRPGRHALLDDLPTRGRSAGRRRLARRRCRVSALRAMPARTGR